MAKSTSPFLYKPGDDVCLTSKPNVRGWVVSCGPRTCCVNWDDKGQSIVKQEEIVKLDQYLEGYTDNRDTSIGYKNKPSSPTDKELSPTDNLSLEETFLEIHDIRLDGGTQQRVKVNYDHINTLQDALEEVDELEPVEVIQDGDTYWLVDGFHRISAYKNQGRSVIPARVKLGTYRQAVLESVAANSENRALPRTRADKRKAVETLLLDTEWGKWSDREIAKITRVSHPTVAAIRRSLVNLPVTERTYKTKHGKVSTMETGNIGKLDKEDSWNPEDLGRTDYLEEPDGQSTSVEDYRAAQERFDVSHHEHPPREPEVIAREVVLGIVSNVDILSIEQLKFVRQKISNHLRYKEKDKWFEELKTDFYKNIHCYEVEDLEYFFNIIKGQIQHEQHLRSLANVGKSDT